MFLEQKRSSVGNENRKSFKKKNKVELTFSILLHITNIFVNLAIFVDLRSIKPSLRVE
jgi:hypothetical protein